MPSLQDLKQWKPGTLDSVATELLSRRQRLLNLADDLEAGLPSGELWSGESSTAAKSRLKSLNVGLAEQLQEVGSVVKALDAAADKIRSLQTELDGIEYDAQSHNLSLDLSSGQVTYVGPPIEDSDDPVLRKSLIQHAIDRVVADMERAISEANDADWALYGAMLKATSTDPTNATPLSQQGFAGMSQVEIIDYALENPDIVKESLPDMPEADKQALGVAVSKYTNEVATGDLPLTDEQNAADYAVLLDFATGDSTVAASMFNHLEPDGAAAALNQIAIANRPGPHGAPADPNLDKLAIAYRESLEVASRNK